MDEPQDDRLGQVRVEVDRAIRRDDRVILLGQDIAEYGGVFKVTEGFVEEFGKARVRNTPIGAGDAVRRQGPPGLGVRGRRGAGRGRPRDRGDRPAVARPVGRRRGRPVGGKTGRCLVLHEAPLTGGFGGEVAATVGREAFEWLDAPVARLGALDTPVPFAKALEASYSPKGRPLPALRDLLAY
jgi:hypothetical protein